MNKLKQGFNQRILNEITLDESLKNLRSCIQCGTCSASCPSGRWSPFRTREVIKKAQAGLESVLSDQDIWLCSTCFNCYERCPRNIPVTEIIIKLRNIAVREGHIVEPIKSVIKNLLEYGHAVPIGPSNSNWIKLREYHGLSKLPPTVHSDLNALTELAKITDVIKFNKRIHYR